MHMKAQLYTHRQHVGIQENIGPQALEESWTKWKTEDGTDMDNAVTWIIREEREGSNN